jgi:cell division protein FtsW (lipid II flippase)
MGRGCIRVVNSNIEEFVEEICSHVKLKRAHKEIRIELLNHIEEKTEDLMLEGISEEEASKKALSEMGQASIIGSQLNESHKATPEWGILGITFIFSLLGLITGYFILINGIGSNITAFQKSILFNIIGYITVIGLYFFNYKKLEKYAKHIFIGVTGILFIQTLIGTHVNGSSSRIHLGLFSMDITEISLFLYVIAFSKLIKELDLKSIKEYIYLSLMLLIPFILYLQLVDAIAAVTYFVVFMVFLFMKKVKKTYIFSVIALFLTSGGYFSISAPYLMHRLTSFINAKSHAQTTGYVNVQIDKLLKGTGAIGNGFTFPKGIIPMESEYILAYIIYTFGWIVGITLIALVFAFIIRMFIAAKEVKDSFGKYMIRGFLCIFALEFIWNILMILGFAPIVGITLPFISYGGSRLLVQMAAIGIIMSIYRTKSLSYA